MKRLTSLISLGLACLVAKGVHADWPFARGGSDSTGATSLTLPDEPQVLWTYESGGSAFEATPVIHSGVVYAGDADGTLHAVRLEDGESRWTKTFENTFLLTPPAASADAVYTIDADGMVRCLAAADGEVRWSFDATSEAYGGPLLYQVDDETSLVFVPTEAGVLFALDASTGETRWNFEIPAPLRCTPTVVGGHTLLAGCDGKLHTVEVATGKEVGTCDIGDPTGNTAAVVNDVAYFGTEGGTFYAIDASDPAQPTVLWTDRDQRHGQGIRTAAAVTPGAIYYANQAKTIYARDPTTGKPIWSERTRAGVKASPLALGGDRVLLLTSRGRMLMLDSQTGKKTWSYDAGGEFLASPAASGGRVIVANTDGSLICFGAKD